MVIWYEYRKALQSPIIWILLVLFLCFNYWTIQSRIDAAPELQAVNALVRTYGQVADEQALTALRKDLADKDELLSIHEYYLQAGEQLEEKFASVNWEDVAETNVSMMMLSGEAAAEMKKAYEKVEERASQMQQNKEQLHWYMDGAPARMHSFLFSEVYGLLFTETMLLVVLMTSFVTNYERDNRSLLTVMATKRGKKLMRDKLVASLLLSASAMLFLSAVTLGYYFITYDYSALMNSSVVSAFNWEWIFPLVSWSPITLGQYLIYSLLAELGLMLLICGFTYALTLVIRNVYIVFVVMGMLSLIGYLLPALMSTSSVWLFYSIYTPISMLYSMGSFMLAGGARIYPHYEMTVLLIWGSLLTITLVAARQWVKRQQF